MSQHEVDKLVSVHDPVIGRYERNEVKPTIEMATKITNALKVSLDYLVGSTDLVLDTKLLKRIEQISKLTPKEKEHIYITIDALIRDFNAKKRMLNFYNKK